MDNSSQENILFIKWFPYDKRNEAISSSLGANCYFIHSLKKRKWNTPVRYILQFIKTIKLFYKKKPSLIIVTNPPIFAACAAALYCAMRNGHFIMDSHTGAFDRKWKFLKFLHKYISHRALLNIVTNNKHEEIYLGWKAKTFILSDLVFEIPKKNTLSLGTKYNIVAICSFSPDEPIEEIIEAARELSDIKFYITGDYNRAKYLIEKKPINVYLTGFLPDQEYYDLLHASDLIMVLVNRENTMQQGAYEAISIKKPMILSNSKILKEIYKKGTVFVDNNRQAIKEGILLMIRNYDTYKNEMNLLFEERKKIWDQKCHYLWELIKAI